MQSAGGFSAWDEGDGMMTSCKRDRILKMVTYPFRFYLLSPVCFLLMGWVSERNEMGQG